MSGFPHSNLRTDYSFLSSTQTVEATILSAVESQVPLAVADVGTLGGALMVGLSCKSKNAKVGVGVSTVLGHETGQLGVRLHPRDVQGWKAICDLGISRTAITAMSRLQGLTSVDVVIETGPEALHRNRSAIGCVKALFDASVGQVFVEDFRIPRVCGSYDRTDSQALILTANKAGATSIAAAPVRYRSPDQREMWSTLRLIQKTRSKGKVPDIELGCHLLDSDEMRQLFEDAPAALSEAEKFTSDHLWAPGIVAPALPVFRGSDNPANTLVSMATAALESDIAAGTLASKGREAEYRSRLAHELDVICRLGFASYFLIVAEFCRWSGEVGISVGPGRGSGAGSLVARCIGITAVDPVAHGLYFERFLNPDRVSLPDFDVDFAEDRIGEVFGHLRSTHGDSAVARIATYTALGGKLAIKEIAASRSIPFQSANAVTAFYPEDAPTISQALNDSSFNRALDREPGMRDVCHIAASIEGVKRQIGLHAAGVVISPSTVSSFAPVFRDAEGNLVTSYDMKSAELSGLVKFDILSLSTLSTIDDARTLLANSGAELPPSSANMIANDPEVFRSLAEGHSVSVFQFDDMSSALARVAPTRFEDLVALNALYRPGPIANIPIYASRKEGIARGLEIDLELPHPQELTKVSLGETYGILVYQEQVMEIARICAGFSLSEADSLRRAIGKKIASEIEKTRVGFIEGCVRSNGMTANEARDLFATIEKFANYGFNKSHSVAYAHLGYVTAWYKIKHPDAWLSASLNRESDPRKRSLLCDEARRLGVTIHPPDVNESDLACSIDREAGRVIRLGLAFPKGLGKNAQAVRAIINERGKAGRFSTIADFWRRCGGELSSTQIDALVSSGAFDSLESVRSRVAKSFTLLAEMAPHGPKRQVEASLGLFENAGISLGGYVHIKSAPETEAAIKVQAGLLLESRSRNALEVERIGFLCDETRQWRLISRSSGCGFTANTSAGRSKLLVQPCGSVRSYIAGEIASGHSAGRLAVTGLVTAVLAERQRGNATGHSSLRVEIKADFVRMSVRASGTNDFLNEFGNKAILFESSVVPAALTVEWAISREGGIDLSATGIASIHEVIFDATPDDLRIKVSRERSGAGGDAVTELSYAIKEALEATNTPGRTDVLDKPPIILISDGASRFAMLNEWAIDDEAVATIRSINGVEEIYQGKKKVWSVRSAVDGTIITNDSDKAPVREKRVTRLAVATPLTL